MSLGPFVRCDDIYVDDWYNAQAIESNCGEGKSDLGGICHGRAQVDIVCVVAISTYTFHSSFTNRKVLSLVLIIIVIGAY
jgi:hypothetical protein